MADGAPGARRRRSRSTQLPMLAGLIDVSSFPG
jgi:hypothetical protein